MNNTTVIFLVNRNTRAIACSYEVIPDGKGKQPYTIFKSLDPSLAVGDYVVVPTDTRHNFTVNRIEQVDVEFDIDTTQSMKWIVSKFDRADYEKILAQETTMLAAIKSAEMRKKRDELRKAIMIDQTAEEEIKALPLYVNGDTAKPAIE